MGDYRRLVRGQHGLIPAVPLPYAFEEVKRWRKAESDADRPSSLADFFRAHRICPECGGYGVHMIGWSDPKGADEMKAAEDLNLNQLPLYEVCPACRGGGVATSD